jgi:prepilin-type processing-associated H-X9-DG protein
MLLVSGGQYTGTPHKDASERKGTWWFRAAPVNVSFHTLLPPNGPTCVNITRDAQGGSHAMKSASSYHAGGVNACAADGSVKFISETINCGNLATAKIKASGASEFGIWGAFGSRNGRESVALP